MADIQSNINLNINTAGAMAEIKNLQRAISVFHSTLAKGSATAAAQSANMQQNLLNSINKTGQFSAQMTTVRTTTESFTNALEKNKLSMGEYFRYAGASTKTFGRLFRSEFATINKVARERVKDLQTQYIKMGRDANGAMRAIAVRPVALDMQNLGTQTQIAAQRQMLFNQLLRQGSTNLLNFGKNTQWAGRQLMVGFTIPLTIFGSVAAREFMKLEEQAIKFKRVYGDMFTTSGETEKALDNIKELAREFTKYGIAAENTIELAAKVAQMGNMGDALEAQVRQATRLSVLGGLEQQEALDTTISLTNAFGIATEDLADKINFLNAAENQTILSIEDFNTAIPLAGSVVKQLGGDVEDLAFFLTAMREGGINASQGANALKSSLARLINPTEAAQKRLAEMGINVMGIVEANAGNLRGTVVGLGQELDKLDPLTRARAIEQLFGKFQFARMSTLFANISKEGSQANKVLQLTGSTAQELGVLAERELGKVENSVTFKFKKSLEEFQMALAPFGEAFLKAVTPIIEFGTKILDKFNELGDGTKQFIVIAGAALGVIGPVALMTFGLIANGVANVIKLFATLGTGYQRLTGQNASLGLSTEYMTREQLQAQAVAASLDQTHSRLVQTFTVERAALDNLAGAYRRATTAQRNFSGPVVAGGRVAAPRKLAAGGIISGPGTGTSDSILAMVSNGEAIIPAKVVKENQSMISQLISGSLPRFAGGRDPFDKWHSAPEPVRKATGQMVWGTKQAELDAIERTAKKYNLSQTQQRNLSLNVASHIKPESRKVDVGGKMMDQKVWRAGNLMPDFQAANQFTENMRSSSKILNDFNKTDIARTAKTLGISQKEVTTTLDKFKKGVAPSTRQEAKVFREVAKTTLANAQKVLNDPNASKTARAAATRAAYQADVAKSVMDERLRPRRGYYENMPKYDSSVTTRAAKAQETKLAKVRRDLGAETAKSTRATKASTAAAAKQTEATKKQTQTTQRQTATAKKQSAAEKRQTQQQKRAAQQRSAAAAKGWETRRANQAASAANANQGSSAGAAAAKSRLGIGAGGIMGIAAAGAIGASFVPGKVGEVAQQLLLPLMMLPMILPLLKNPIVLAIAAVAALGAGVYLLQKQLEDAAKSGIEAAKAMSMTAEKLVEISEVTGTVSATESRKMAQEQQLTAVGPEFTSFGISFMDSDPGKAMLGDIEKQIGQGRNVAEVGQNIGSQLATGIFQGVLTMDQARSISAALGAELGDYTISTQISGKLTELLGVDGTDITKEPLEVAFRLKEDSMREQAASFEQAISMIKPRIDFVGGSLMAMGSATFLTGGAMAGTGAGFVPGALTMAAGATMMGISLVKENATRAENTKLAGAALQLGVEQIAQNQMLLDSVNQRYAVLKAEAETQEEINRLERNRREDIDRLNAANAETTNQILEQAKLLKSEGLYNEAMETSVKNMYEEGSALDIFAEKAIEKLGKLEDQDFAMSLTLSLASGEMDPVSVLRLLELGATNPTFQANYDLVMREKGLAQTNQLVQLLSQNALSDTAFTIMFDLVAQKDEPEFSEALDALAYISSAEARYPVNIDLELNGEESLQNVTNDLQRYKDIPETMTKEAFVEIAGSDEKLLAILDNWEELELTDNIHRQFVLDYIVMTSGDDSMVRRYFAETGKSMTGTKTGEMWQDLPGGGETPRVTVTAPAISDSDRYDAAMYYAKQRAPIETAVETAEEEEAFDDAAGGGTPSSVLDNLLKKLRDVRDATIGVAKGWDAARASLDRLFAGGETLTMFSGLEQKMRGFNLGEDLISLIVGMDPDEFDKRKGELFTFDAKGNITGITTALRGMALAMKSIAMGDFQSQQQKTLKTYNDQLTAIQKLVAAGMTHAAAYEAVQDAAFASAIAQEQNNRTIRDTVKDANAAAKALKDFAAAQSVVSANQTTASQRDILSWMQRNAGKLTNAQIEAILKDTNLQRLILDPTVDPAAVNQALKDAANAAQLELDVKKLTISGMEDVFNDGFGKAMERFGAMEQEIELDFSLRTKDDRSLVEASEREIAGLRFKLDDLEADLFRIAEVEDAINEEYDARLDSLDKVASINEKIARQQKAQLSVADALSQGDIAAAARASAEYRQEQAQSAIEERKKALEEQRELALSGARGKLDKSRLQIEQEIKDIQMAVFDIEEDRLEPAQRRLEIATQEKNDTVESLEVLGRTREEWTRIQNSIDLARTNSETYKKAIQGAVDIVQDIIHYWNELDGKQVTTYHQIVETRVSTPSPPPASPGNTSGSTNNGSGSLRIDPNSSERDQALASLRMYEASLAQAQAAMYSWNRQINMELIPKQKRLQAERPSRPRAIALQNVEREIAAARSQVNVNAQEYNGIKAQINALKTKWRFATGGSVDYKRMGGLLPYKALGGIMNAALGGMFQSVNTDSIPAMLTAGEYVVKRSAVQKFGVDNLEKINSGTYNNGSVYNYSLNVNVRSEADPTKIARTVMAQIKQVDAQRIRGNRF
jgi:TP901 family phage tail tape measure protein